MPNDAEAERADPWGDDGLLDIESGYQIGLKVVEMCDRLKIDSVLPGMRAEWVLEIDEQKFTVTVERGDHREKSSG